MTPLNRFSLVDVVLEVLEFGASVPSSVVSVALVNMPISTDEQWDDVGYRVLAKPMACITRQFTRQVVDRHHGDAFGVIHGTF